MRDFKKLEIWRRSHDLTIKIYALTKSFPRAEKFGLTSQLRRAASSVPINIAEGAGRLSQKDFARFLTISFGSISEVEYILLLVSELEYISFKDYEELDKEINEIKKMIYSYHNRLTTR